MKEYQVVDKELIKERSLKYGNNFPMIAKLWNNYFKTILGLDVNMGQSDVAMLMGLMKVSRLNKSPNDEDTLNDLFNYMWIGENYEEYIDMIQYDYDKDDYEDDYDEDDYDEDGSDLNYIIDVKGLMEEINKILS